MTAAINPLLARVKLPGRVFQLPSKGLFYKPGVLADDVKNGELEVRPMSALAEMKMRTADLLYSGKVLKDLCTECAPGVLQPDELVSQDVDALFAFLRIVTYGDKHKVSSMHVGCKKVEGKVHEYEISLEPLLMNSRNSALDHKDALYTIPLSNGQVVYSKPNSYGSSITVMHMQQEAARIEADGKRPPDDMIAKMSVLDLMSVIDHIETPDGQGGMIKVSDPQFIAEWAREITRPIMKEVVTAVNTANETWGYEFKAELACKDCGEKFKHALELDPVNFFFG